MKVVALFLLFASSVFAQNNAGAAYSCGPPNVQFDVKKDNSQHSIGQPEAGKALVYVIEVFQRPPGELGTPTIRVGLNGAWIGANRGTSYLFFSVEPGEYHLCTNWQSSLKRLSDQHSLTNFIADAGKTYFFRVQTHVQTNSVRGEVWSIELEPVNPDEAKYMIATSPLSISQAKK